MLWCETAGSDAADLEALAVALDQFVRAGIPACVDVRSIPAGLPRNAQFDLVRLQRDGPPPPGATVALIAAQRLTDARLMALRRLAGPEPRPSVAFGRFGSAQAVIGVRARLSYVFGRDPEIVDLIGRGPLGDLGAEWPVFGVARPPAPAQRPRLLLVGPDLTEPREQAALAALAPLRRFAAAVLTDGKAKKAWTTAQGALMPAFHYGETLPGGLAARVEICAVFASPARNYRLQSLIANLAVSGAVLIDCTPQHGLAQASDAFLRGPIDVAGLAAFVTAEVLPNLAAISAQVRGSATAQALARPPLPIALHAPATRRPATARPARARVVIMPTNGVGLGHAQRCALVAEELDRDRFDPVFAVFPSCMRLVRGRGFDAMPLVPRSDLHAQSHETDLVNHLRLRALAEGASAMVFDGGYVFDSVYRTALETPMPAVWIRRGLWQAHQDNRLPLDREKAFARVIVPMEAFDELNAAYSRGPHLHPVGPITRRVRLAESERGALRAALAERRGRPFERLVVTQLGGGVAADRSAQVQAIAGLLERRRDVLHLVLVWPGGAVHPAWFAWSGTRIVRTRHAGALAAAADLVISAAGYNAFHETLYGALPTIFMPQTGGFMDDQAARARAANDRGLAGLVEPHELMKLEREIGRWLDGDAAALARARLAETDLPEAGNARAARLIEEVIDGDRALEHAARADRPAGRG